MVKPEATAEDLAQNRQIERLQQDFEKTEAQLDRLAQQVTNLTVAFAPFKVIEDVLADVRKIVEVLREKGIV